MGMLPETDSLSPWGELPEVPQYDALKDKILIDSGREEFSLVVATLEDLGRAVQLGQHRRLVEELDVKLNQLGRSALLSIAAAALEHPELCQAFSVYLTCLEQTYHWPREIDVVTPPTLNEHKMVIQVFHEPELRTMLDEYMLNDEKYTSTTQERPFSQEQMTLAALEMSREMFEEATAAKAAGKWPIERKKQDRVNLLNRTARGDIWDQGPYASRGCHKEMGRLHEMIRTNGTQRRCQEIFQASGGVSSLQRMPFLLANLDSDPTCSFTLVDAVTELQFAVACATEELFSMLVDEVNWGHTFSKWSKAAGVCDIGSSGSDCPLFWMLDGFIGRADPKGQAILPDSLATRSRFFPPDVTALVKALASAPSLRAYVARSDARYPLVQAWKGFQHLMHNMYDIHRKKAMRIIIALRAGRGKTSSGVQEAKQPELELSNTLYQALNIRFGDVKNLNIDAYAWSSPLVLGASGFVETARARFVLSTPLAVSPGDTVSVSVPLPVEGGSPEVVEWHERTYSVTNIDGIQWTNKNVGGPQLAGSVEVCVRNQGTVSGHICNQQIGFPVRLRINSTPHFRIQGNTSPRDETVFVAQNGAVGVFIAWLARQQTLVGKYRLVVGVRNLSMLAYSTLLHRLAATFGSALRIVVALSRPARRDVQTLISGRLKPYTGRATGYLSLCSLAPGKKTWYVCGSAEFGLDAARCIDLRPKMHGEVQADVRGLGSRLRPILTSELAPVRLHVAGSSTTAVIDDIVAPRMIPRTELALHNQPEDRWIALGERVFDISILPTFHPGGEKVLADVSGREAQGMLDTVHRGSHMVESMLEKMVIGRLAPIKDPKWESIIDNIVAVQNDLEVQSRFEQTPTGEASQLERATSAEIIRGSLLGLVREWPAKVLSCHPDTQDVVSQLQAAYQEVVVHLDEVQARAYTEHFADVEMCATVLKYIHECHYKAISKTHDMIDELKREIYESIEILQVPPEESLLRKGTEEIVRALREMVVEDTL